MKIIKNNCKTKNTWPKLVKCEKCGSEIEIEPQDLSPGYLGVASFTCPACGKVVPVYGTEYDLDITKDNVVFPDHFYHFKEKDTDSDIDTKEIRRYINNAVCFFRDNPEAFCYYTGSGDLAVIVLNYSGDEEYNVTVCKGYYETTIPFEKEDFETVTEDAWENNGVKIKDETEFQIQ